MSKKKLEDPIIVRDGKFGVAVYHGGAFSFDVAGSSKMASPGVMSLYAKRSMETDARVIGKYKIFPRGERNLLPFDMRDIFEENNLTEGVFKRQRGLIWGQGPTLYKEDLVNGEKKRTWVESKEVMSWLESFDYEEELLKAVVDYYHMEGHFAKFTPGRGGRVGNTTVASIESVGYQKCCLEWAPVGKTSEKIIVGDWLNPKREELTDFPVFNPKSFTSTAIGFYNMKSFARDIYGLPAHYGTLDWIRRGSAIPRILEALSKNSLNLKYHVQSPEGYWVKKERELSERCANNNIEYKDDMLVQVQDEMYAKLIEVMGGEENVGKIFTSVITKDENDRDVEWKITPIEQKVKEYVSAQLLIAKQADSAIVSGMGLHPSLSNIMIEGKLASGSELLYALKLYLATEITIPERIICKPFNQAIAMNFPNTGIKIGFYHEIVKTEDTTTPANRVKNVV